MAYTLDWLMFFSDKSKLLTLGIVSVFGVVAGSAVYALLSAAAFRWEGFREHAGHRQPPRGRRAAWAWAA